MSRKPIILCVDDEKVILNSLRILLFNEFGNEYEIELAESGNEALEIYKECKNKKVDLPLIIVDYLMPGMKGDELIIKLHQKDKKMLKILLTGQATLEGVTNVYNNAHLYRYISKPWELKDLLLTIHEALRSYYNDRSLEELLHEKISLIKKIQVAEYKYRGIFENAVEGIFQTTTSGEIIAINPALARILGYNSMIEAISLIKSLKQDLFCNPEDWNTFFNKLKAEKGTGEFETLFYKKDKRKIWVLISAHLIFDEKNKIELFEGFIQDIMEKKKAREELHETRLEIIRKLGRAAEYKDKETGMHVIRISKICKALAVAIGQEEEDAELIMNASPMHDIGKIGIPDNILLKPEKLDDDEWEIMKKHAEIGAKIIGNHPSKLLQAAKTVALYHHEKWDGQGYPAKKKGKEIPVIARIVALADVFDALTSKRPFKNAWTIDKAISFIQKEKGNHFEPRLVDAFMKILPEIKEIKKRHIDP